jgi:hypothetical protein
MIGKPAPDRFAWERAVRASDLPATPRLAAYALATFMDRDGSSCYPSVATIAGAMGVRDVRTVRRALDVLAAGGWVHRERGGGRRRTGAYVTNVYLPTIPAAEGACDAPVPRSRGTEGEGSEGNGGIGRPPKPPLEGASDAGSRGITCPYTKSKTKGSTGTREGVEAAPEFCSDCGSELESDGCCWVCEPAAEVAP